MESQLLNKVHNFGIYRKGGKRCILQLDFLGRTILLIHKGHIKKCLPMSLIEHYDSEDGLRIMVKLKDGEMVFEADNMEEKYSLCCLLGLAMQLGQEGDEDSIDSGHGHGFLSDPHLDNSDVIKDGLLEKKGNTAITTWNKRRIRLTPGELSYYKPGEELALNVIQLWKDRCVLKKHQHNGFTLKTRARVYSFRTVHDYKATHMTEIARDDWFEAFEKAMNTPPSSSKILDINAAFSDNVHVTLRHQPHHHHPHHHQHHHNDVTTTRSSSIDSSSNVSQRSSCHSNSSSSTGSHDPANYSGGKIITKATDEEHIYDSTPDILEQSLAASCLYTQPVPKSLRGNTLPTIPSTSTAAPTDHSAPDKHILAFLKRSQSSEDLLDIPAVSAGPLNVRRQSREFHGLSPLTSDTAFGDNNEPILASSASTSNLADTNNDKEDIFSGTAAAFRAKLALKGGKSSALKNYKAKKEMKQNNIDNNYKLDGMKRGVCKAYNMFLAGADFRTNSLDRNPNRSIPQFHPIIETESTTTTPSTAVKATRQRSATLGGIPSVEIKDSVQPTTTTTTTTTPPPLPLPVPERTTSLSASPHSSPSLTTTTTTTTTSAPSTNDINAHQPTTAQNNNNNNYNNNNQESQIKTDIPDDQQQQQHSLIYSEPEPDVEIRSNFVFIPNDDEEENQTQTQTQNQKKPRELSTFSSSALMPSTEAATLLIRDKLPTITTNPHEPLTASTPTTTTPKTNTKTNPKKVPPLPVAPPSLSRQNKTHTNAQSPLTPHTKTPKLDKPVDPPPAPPTPAPNPTPLAPPPPPLTFDLDPRAAPGIAGPYVEIAETSFSSSKSTNAKSQGLRLKQIHWTKLGNTQLTSSLWNGVNDVTDKLDLTELEEQFAVVNSKSSLNKNNNPQDKQMLVDTKRAQNLGILFCGLKLESIHKLQDALNSTTELESFTVDRLATLKRCQPTTEELEMYRGYSTKAGSDENTLHDVDRFMVRLCEIPKLGLRLDTVLTLWEYPGQYAALEEELGDILTASDQLLDSVSLAKVLEYILAIGNVMNATWGCKQDAGGFQLSSLDKILSVKGRDSKTTLCGYLVRQLKRSDNGLLAWPDTVEGVTKCSGYSTKAVGAEIDVLKNDLQKIKRSLKTLRNLPSIERGFLLDVQSFIAEYDRKLNHLDLKYVKVSDKYKDLLLRFGEPASSSSESIFTMMCGFVEKFKQAKMDQEV